MACGVPVAAYPVAGPIDVVEDGVTGALDEELSRAARRALAIDPQKCRERALRSGWELCSREFESNLVPAGGQRAQRALPIAGGAATRRQPV
jgi:glycosyltransferase involved in cell wall biosynthesis